MRRLASDRIIETSPGCHHRMSKWARFDRQLYGSLRSKYGPKGFLINPITSNMMNMMSINKPRARNPNPNHSSLRPSEENPSFSSNWGRIWWWMGCWLLIRRFALDSIIETSIPIQCSIKSDSKIMGQTFCTWWPALVLANFWFNKSPM